MLILYFCCSCSWSWRRLPLPPPECCFWWAQGVTLPRRSAGWFQKVHKQDSLSMNAPTSCSPMCRQSAAHIIMKGCCCMLRCHVSTNTEGLEEPQVLDELHNVLGASPAFPSSYLEKTLCCWTDNSQSFKIPILILHSVADYFHQSVACRAA